MLPGASPAELEVMRRSAALFAGRFAGGCPAAASALGKLAEPFTPPPRLPRAGYWPCNNCDVPNCPGHWSASLPGASAAEVTVMRQSAAALARRFPGAEGILRDDPFGMLTGPCEAAVPAPRETHTRLPSGAHWIDDCSGTAGFAMLTQPHEPPPATGREGYNIVNFSHRCWAAGPA
jgi:hypothetical protein